VPASNDDDVEFHGASCRRDGAVSQAADVSRETREIILNAAKQHWLPLWN
jgi:hypothetical protein